MMAIPVHPIPLRIALAAGVALCAVTPATAQSVDYQALQETIGEAVTTSVTGKPQRASELPAATVIITRDEIARAPARDIPGLLQSYAGIDVNRWTAGQTDVAVRGGVQTYNARLLVLVDGRQVYLDHYGMTDWNLIGVQLEEIQQIELVRGPASALFGFNAASGVVNIITRRVGARPAATASVDLGNHGIARYAATLALPLTGRIGARLAASHAREDERRIPGELLAPSKVSDVVQDQISGEIEGAFDGTDVVLGGGHTTNRQIEYLPSQLLSNQRYRSDNIHARMARDTDWGGWSLGSYANWLDVTYGGFGEPGEAGTFSTKNRIVATKASGVVRIDAANTIRIGGEYRNSMLHSLFQFSDKVSYDVGSADVMLDLHPDDRIAITAAGRLDRLWLHQSGTIMAPAYDDPADFDRAFTRFSFNVALLVKTGGNGQIRLNGGRGVQLPSLTHLALRLPINGLAPFPVIATGSPRMRPVVVWSGELGYVRDVGSIRLEATGFATRTEDAIGSPGDAIPAEFTMIPTPTAIARFRNIGDYTTYGTELSASGRVGGLDWRGNYTWTHTDEHLPPLTLPIAYPLSPRSTTPAHKANVVLGYDTGRWSFAGNARYTSATRQFAFSAEPRLRLFRVGEAVTVDLRAGYRLTARVQIYVAGENLTLADGATLSPIPADRRVRGGIRLTL